MTKVICKEYLEWLNLKMKRDRDRKVLLLIDNFSGHKLAVNLVWWGSVVPYKNHMI
jgi:DDE superfamily endonuclease